MRVRLFGFALAGIFSTGLAACHQLVGSAGPSPTPSACVSPTAPPGALTVTSNADSGPGSLRDTLASAPPNSVIVFASSLGGETISISSAPITIGNSVTLSGPCQGATLAGSVSGASSLVNVAAGTTVTLSNLTITSTGVTALALGVNAMVSGSSLSIVGSSANSCVALNIPQSATMNLNGGSISNNTSSSGDGVICAAGVLDAVNMAFSQNATGGAGVLDVLTGGKATVEQSEFDGNKAGGNGGALSINGGSGSVINTTFYANSGSNGGAVYVGPSGNLNLNFNTIAGNTATPAQVTNTGPSSALILHNNIIDTLVGTVDVSGTFTSEGYNFVYNTGFTNGWLGSDLLHLPLSLYKFGNYGGPTNSLPPEKGARVISAADPANGFPQTDQRGILRPQGPQPCIGSIEYNPSKPP